MKINTYKCDLCDKEIKPVNIQCPNPNKSKDFVVVSRFAELWTNSNEKHVCTDCVEILINAEELEIIDSINLAPKRYND